ncbi:preprotein translocase subunit SecY [bacterium]|nr:preprotein translocase subunit SecY [bacterium]NBX98366.1 preprotein translocase subunit SecY [bacterium]NDC93730.1 preprotein translocase subunit SecY [bacterium]NDD82871.1 preprotein translocase subunit SecY [bacterium]NDG28666.1 preprotein translocase subunit SecY [bacterium]
MNWKLIGRSLKNEDMRKRLLAVAGMLLVFRLLAHIPIPIGTPETLKQVLEGLFTAAKTTQLLGFLDILSGGALANLSIMLIGLGPYINASIIMQLLTQAIPKLEALNKEGEFGRKKINQYTRMLAFPLAIIQSIGAVYLVSQTASPYAPSGNIAQTASIGQWVLMVAALTGGSMLLMWLGELITEQGLGNGISLLITVGIVSRLPATIASLATSIFSGKKNIELFGKSIPVSTESLLIALVILVSVVITTYLVVKLNEASRKITIHYAKRVQGNRTYGGVTTILPVKVITAGVVPIIFALAFLSLPEFLGRLLANNSSARLVELGNKLVVWFQTPSAQTFEQPGFTPYIYPIVYFVLIIMFTFFYTGITFNSKEIAENLQKQGGFIEGVRSGVQTQKYLQKVVGRLTLFGSFSLGLLALAPIVAQVFLNTNISIGGTSVLILVAVSIETLRQIESRALMVTYDDYSTPDFFYGADTPILAASGARRLKFGGRFTRRSKDTGVKEKNKPKSTKK